MATEITDERVYCPANLELKNIGSFLSSRQKKARKLKCAFATTKVAL